MIYAIPDLHGRYDLMMKAIEFITGRSGTGKIVFLGDYLSRGPDGGKILKELRHIDIPNFEVVILKGNHESFFSDEDLMRVDAATKRSMQKEGIWKSRKSYAKWCRDLPMYHRDGKYIFVHADWDEKIPDHEQTEHTLIWRRRAPELGFYLDGYTLVHGHTPNVNGPVLTKNRINLDTKAHHTGILHIAEISADARPRIWKISV